MMKPGSVEEIERAIEGLTPQQMEELYLWLEQHHPHPLEDRISSDLAAGRLDKAIQHALDDEDNDRVRPL